MRHPILRRTLRRTFGCSLGAPKAATPITASLFLGMSLLGMGCGAGTDEIVPPVIEALPSADLSTLEIDFGELDYGDAETRQFTLRNGGDLAMGIESMGLMADGMEHNFFFSYNVERITCPVVEGDDADAKDVVTDTGGSSSGSGSSGSGSSGSGSSGSGSSSSGGGTDTGGGGSSSGGNGSGSGSSGGGSGGGAQSNAEFFLDPGCEIPLNITYSPVDLGEVHAAIEILTITDNTDPDDDKDEPEYYRDPDQFKRVVMLEGSSVQGVGNIVVRTPNVDMGHHYTGETSVEYVYIHNVGDGDLRFEQPTLCRSNDCATYEGPHDCIECTEDQSPCDDAFTVNFDTLESSGVLPGGTATLFEVWFTPEDLDAAFCELNVTSADEDTPLVEVSVKGNAGTDPENQPPVVELIWPPVGYVHRSADPLRVELDMFDANQPANTLICKVRSLLGETKIADCKPTDESGHVVVDIELDLLMDGTDTLLVTVTDQSENRAFASTTVLWKAQYPASDDDGDGWGDDADGVHVDCDDNDATVYPSAAELPDGIDNDCDNAIDENTVAGDDDGDSVTELEGDCDDTDPTTYPGAMERPDQKDNNCDGEVDENTSVHDDDGDGFAELDLDCNDRDPEVNPSAVELCDDIDNNCDGFVDEAGCIRIAFDPSIVGGVQMGRNAISVGESTTMTAYAFDPDGQALSFFWNEDPSHSGISDLAAQTITWTAPKKLPGDATGKVYELFVVVQDDDGNQDWAFDEVWVYAEPVAMQIEHADLAAATQQGCGSADDSETAAAAALAIPFLGLFAVARRRRREDLTE
jgi:hypothetical protein